MSKNQTIIVFHVNFKLIGILFFLIIFGCTKTENTSQNSKTLNVSAAISLKNAFEGIGKAFENKSGNKVVFNYGASGVLQKQIENSAPIDVFASAGEKQMDELERLGFIEKNNRANFAENSLVLIVPQDSKIKINKINDLTKPEVEKIAIGNPKTVPAGQYAEESLRNMKLQNSLQKKLILAENVRQVLDYVKRDEVDAGIVYQTDALPAGDDVRIVASFDQQSLQTIFYPIAIIKGSKNKELAREFTKFVLSGEGQRILKKNGFKGTSQK